MSVALLIAGTVAVLNRNDANWLGTMALLLSMPFAFHGGYLYKQRLVDLGMKTIARRAKIPTRTRPYSSKLWPWCLLMAVLFVPIYSLGVHDRAWAAGLLALLIVGGEAIISGYLYRQRLIELDARPRFKLFGFRRQ